MPDPPGIPLVPPPVVRQVQVGAPQGDRDGFIKPPKHDFPKFDGHLPNLWLDRCLTYFELYHTLPSAWVTTASLYLDGHAALWWQAFRQGRRQIGWENFCQAVQEEFGPDEYELQMHALLQLRQTGSDRKSVV